MGIYNNYSGYYKVNEDLTIIPRGRVGYEMMIDSQRGA